MEAEVEAQFIAAVHSFRRLRAPFDRRKNKKHQYELFIRFEETATYPLFGLYQQTIVGNINVPKKDYMDPCELSWMWSWIKGNRKWHAWNRCRGMTKQTAAETYIATVAELERSLPTLIDQWKDEMDPRIPDEKAWVPDEEKSERLAIISESKKQRRIRDELREQRHQQRRLQGFDSDTDWSDEAKEVIDDDEEVKKAAAGRGIFRSK